MSKQVVVPALGESVTEATVAKWFKNVGDYVEKDEPLVELETDKITLEVNPDSAGALQEQMGKEGGTVEVGAILAILGEGAAKATAKSADQDNRKGPSAVAAPAKAAPAPAKASASIANTDYPLSPAVRVLVEEH